MVPTGPDVVAHPVDATLMGADAELSAIAREIAADDGERVALPDVPVR